MKSSSSIGNTIKEVFHWLILVSYLSRQQECEIEPEQDDASLPLIVPPWLLLIKIHICTCYFKGSLHVKVMQSYFCTFQNTYLSTSKKTSSLEIPCRDSRHNSALIYYTVKIFQNPSFIIFFLMMNTMNIAYFVSSMNNYRNAEFTQMVQYRIILP